MYEVRPLMCRGINSAAAADCERAYRTKGGTLVGTNYKPQGTIVQMAAKALELACDDAGLDGRKLDLTPALRSALTIPDARSR